MGDRLTPPLGFDTARCQKIANPVKTRLSVEVKSVIRGKIEGAKCFASLASTFLKVFVEHLFPTGGVQLGSIRDHAVEVKKHGVVLIAADHVSAVRLLHRSDS